MHPWFLERGYTLYDYEYLRNGEGQIEDIAYVYPSRGFYGDMLYPYSFFGGDPPNTIDRPLSGQALVGIFTDSQCNTSSQLFLASYHICPRLTIPSCCDQTAQKWFSGIPNLPVLASGFKPRLFRRFHRDLTTS